MKKLKLIFAVCFLFISGGGALAASNQPVGDIGNYGAWATENNHKLFLDSITNDLGKFTDNFQKKSITSDYVPIEAKIGRAFMGAMSKISDILNRSLVRFIEILLVVLFAFWIFFESYNMMETGGDPKKLWQSIIWKAVVIGFWLWLIQNNAANIFMDIFGPIISISSYLSDFILNSITNASGANLPDTCAAIHNFMVGHGNDVLINSSAAADLLCVPTRLSGFFYTCVSAGFAWMKAGLGHSAFTFAAGAVFVVVFIYNIWKFALMALNVIADLFFAIMLLPFTALAECFGGGTTYGGLAGNFFKTFAGVFNTAKMESIIMKFINASIYFVSLSVVVAVSAAILSGVTTSNLAAQVPTIDNSGFMITLIVGCLVAYLANKAGDIAGQIGGSIEKSGFGDKVGKDINELYKSGRSWGQANWKVIRKKK